MLRNKKETERRERRESEERFIFCTFRNKDGARNGPVHNIKYLSHNRWLQLQAEFRNFMIKERRACTGPYLRLHKPACAKVLEKGVLSALHSSRIL